MPSRDVIASSSSSSAAVPPRPRRPPPRKSPDDVKPLSPSAPIPQEKEQLDTRSRRAALLSAAFSALATSAGLSSDRAAALAATSTSAPTSPPLSPPPPPAGWSYSRKGKDWPSLGFDSCGLVGKQSPINISPPFTRIRRGRREQQKQQQQQPFLELSADYRSAAFDVVVEREITASPKFTVVAGGKGERKGGGGGGGARGRELEQQEQQRRHPAGGIYLLGGEGEEGGSENGGSEKVFYPLVQFHFHRPGEESLEGRRGALGLHLVHQRDEDRERSSGPEPPSPPSLLLPRFVVVAVAFDLSRGGAHDAALDDLFLGGGGGGEDWKEERGSPPWRRIEAFDPSRLLPASSLSEAPSRRLENFFAFDGSLTTPPCTASARFYFAKSRRAAAAEQVSRAVTPRGAQNARPLQERGGRVVWEG